MTTDAAVMTAPDAPAVSGTSFVYGTLSPAAVARGEAGGWGAANLRYLTAATTLVRAYLGRRAAGRGAGAPGDGPAGRAPAGGRDGAAADDPVGAAIRGLDDARAALPAEAAEQALAAALGLSPFERAVVLLCAAAEADERVGPLCAAAAGDARRPYPTFDLALAALPEPHWSALAPSGPLRRWRLVEVTAADASAAAALTGGPLRIDERILHYLRGVPCTDERLDGLTEPVPVPADLPPAHAAAARRMAAAWRAADGRDARRWPVAQLPADDPAADRAIAAAACRALGWALRAVRAADLPATASDRQAFARLWEREAALTDTALLVACDDADGPDTVRAVAWLAEALRAPLVVSAREPLRPHARPVLRVRVPAATAAEQRAVWREALGPAADALNGELEQVTSQFRLAPRDVRAAADEAVAGWTTSDGDTDGIAGGEADGGRESGRPPRGSPLGPSPVGPAGGPASELFVRIWDACRRQSRQRLDGLAERIEPAAAWDDLVLPDGQTQVLREIAAHVRQRDRVYHEWGFAAAGGRGLGITALFAGPSGTGKTLAAEVLAGALRLDLYRIDLSQVVSKYIGETEKNLRRVFDAAEAGGAVLLCDEADALFGKRGEVKDSHDRYANLEVSYLLQRMETYRGLAILTTNLKASMDPAFLRRLRFTVSFPFPDPAQRADIWRRVFPPGVPTVGLDVLKLAKLNVAGGNIRAIALNAAFLAADAGEPVRMAHLLRAARSEYAKLEKPLTGAEVGGWV